MDDGTDSIPRVLGMEDVDGLSDVPLFKRCIVLSLEEETIGLILLSEPQEGPQKAEAGIIMKLEGGESLIAAIGAAISACVTRRRRPTELDA